MTSIVLSAFAEVYESQDSTYRLQIDDSGSGFSSNSSNSTDQLNQNILIGGFEAFDTGYGNNSSGYKFKSGLQPTFEANVSQLSLLTNTDGTIPLYNRLLARINPSGNPTSADGARFALQLSQDIGFGTFNYINPTNFAPDLVTNPNLSFYYQPCAQTTNQPIDATRWDCGTVGGLKRFVQGLKPNTNYCVRVVAMNGDATNSEPGPGLCETTQGLSISLSVSPNTSNFGLLTSNTVKTASPSTTLNSSTNALAGYSVRIIGTGSGSGSASGLYSLSETYLVSSVSGNLDGLIGSNGYGLQGAVLSGSGEVTLDSAWDPTLGGRNSSYVGQILRSTLNLYSSAVPNTTSHQVSASYLATVSPAAPPANDYTDLLTYTIIANW